MALLGERSQNNSYGRHIVGLYLYATGAQRQTISVLAHMGYSSSYTSIVGTSAQKSVPHEDLAPVTQLNSERGQTKDEDDDPEFIFLLLCYCFI